MGPARPRQSPSLRPALAVVALAASILVLGGILALVGTASARPRPAGSGAGRTVAGSSIRAQPARLVLSHIISAGEPPRDIIDALGVPAGATYLGRHEYDRGLDAFDRAVELSAAYSERAVQRFYLQLLSEKHWTLSKLVSSGGGVDIVAEMNGGDGYQWRAVLVLRSEHQVVSPALAGEGSSGLRTRIELALYQVEDAS